MLWFKAWRETKSRVAFALLWALGFLLMFSRVPAFSSGAAGAGAATGGGTLLVLVSTLALIWIFIPLWLAGSGIRTQAMFGRGAIKGLHGSTHYTLSLPVTRTRLVLVRAALGLVETVAVVALLSAVAWALFPIVRASAAPGEWAAHTLTAAVWLFGIYGLGTMVATVADDAVVIPFGTVAVVVLWSLQFGGILPEGVNVFGPMIRSSPMITDYVPWAALIAALAIGAAGLAGAVVLANRQEY